MDKLDMEIIRSLIEVNNAHSDHRYSRKSIQTAARELGVDEGTIRTRLKRLRSSGFLRNWNVFPNPAVAGLMDVALRFRLLHPFSKEDVIRKLRLIDGVFMIRDYHGDSLGLDLVCQDRQRLERRIELVSRIANAETMERVVLSEPSEPFKFEGADLKIVQCISTAPWKPYNLIAKETLLSTKQVKRRMKRMVDGNALLVTASLNYKAAKGIIKGDLLVFHDESASKKEVDNEVLRVVRDRLFASHLNHPEISAFTLTLTNLSEAKEILGSIKQIQGVLRAYLDLVEDQIQIFGSIMDQMVVAPERSRMHKEMARLGSPT